jgi:hypothetical protein
MNWQILDPQGAPIAVTEEQLRGMVRLGHLKRNTMMWCEGLADWTAAEEARPDFFPALHKSSLPGAPVPPPVQVVPPQPLLAGPPTGRRRPVRGTSAPRKSGGMTKWVILILLGVIGVTVVKIINRPKPPGYEELKTAEEKLKGSKTHGAGDSSGEQNAAEAMAQFSRDFRDAGIDKGSGHFGRGKSGLVRRAAAEMDADGFSALCTIRGDTAVFLLHVPDVRKFADDAKEAMGKMAWFAARLGWSELPEPRPVRICVAIQGIALYDRVLEGMALPAVIGDDEELTFDKFGGGLQSTVTGSAEAMKKIAAYFTKSAGKSK